MEEPQEAEKVVNSLGISVTFAECCILAIISSPNRTLPADGVYNYVEKIFPEKENSSWKSSIRHALHDKSIFRASSNQKDDSRKSRRGQSYSIIAELTEKIDAGLNTGVCLLLALQMARKPKEIHNKLVEISSNDPSLPYYLRTHLQSITQPHSIFERTGEIKRRKSRVLPSVPIPAVVPISPAPSTIQSTSSLVDSGHDYINPDQIIPDEITQRREQTYKNVARHGPVSIPAAISMSPSTIKTMKAIDVINQCVKPGFRPVVAVANPRNQAVGYKPNMPPQQLELPPWYNRVNNPREMISGRKEGQSIVQSAPHGSIHTVGMRPNDQFARPIQMPTPTIPTYQATTRFKPAPKSEIDNVPPITVKANRPVHGHNSVQMLKHPSAVHTNPHSAKSQQERAVFTVEQDAIRLMKVRNAHKGLPHSQYPPHTTGFTQHKELTYPSAQSLHQGKFPVAQFHSNKVVPYKKPMNDPSSMRKRQPNPHIVAALMKSNHPPPPLFISLPHNIGKEDPSSSYEPLDLTKNPKSIAEPSTDNTAEKLKSVESSGESISSKDPTGPPHLAQLSANINPPFSIESFLHSTPSSFPSTSLSSLFPPTSASSTIPTQSIAPLLPSQSIIHPDSTTFNPNLLLPSFSDISLQIPSNFIQPNTTSTIPKFRKVVRSIWKNPQQEGDQQPKMDRMVPLDEQWSASGPTLVPSLPLSSSHHPSFAPIPPSSNPSSIFIPSSSSSSSHPSSSSSELAGKHKEVMRNPLDNEVRIESIEDTVAPAQIPIEPATVFHPPTGIPDRILRILEAQCGYSIPTVVPTVSTGSSEEVRVNRIDEPLTTSSISIVQQDPVVIRVETRNEIEYLAQTSSSISSLPPTTPQDQSNILVEKRKEIETVDLEADLTENANTSQPMEIHDDVIIDNEAATTGETHESPMGIQIPHEMESTMNEIAQDISSIDLTARETEEPSTTPQVISSVGTTQQTHKVKDIPQKEGIISGTTKFKPVHLPPNSTELLPIPSAPVTSSIFVHKYINRPHPSSNLPPPTNDPSKSIYTKAQHTSLPAPMKRKEVQEKIGLINPKKVLQAHRPAVINRPITNIIPVKVNEPPKKMASILSRGETKEVPKSQIALSLLDKNKEDETDGREQKETISRRKALKEQFRAAVERNSPPPSLEIVEDEEIEEIGDKEEDKRENDRIEEDKLEEDQRVMEVEEDGIIFEGTSKKKRIRFNCISLEFEDEEGFPSDKSERLNRSEETIDIYDAVNVNDWKDSIVDFTIKLTEKEREAENFVEDERTEKQKKADRRKEIIQLKKEGLPVTRKKNDGRLKKTTREFNPEKDRFIEGAIDSQARRQNGQFGTYLNKKPLHEFQKHSPFYLRDTIDGIERGTPHKREHQRLHFTNINPNPNLPHILTGGHNRCMAIHSYLTGSAVNNHRPHATYATDAAWSYCGNYIIAVGTDRLVVVLEPEGYPNIKSRLYSEDIPIGARFTENGNLSVVAMKTGILNVMDWRVEARSAIIRKITGMPEITCMDTNPLNWARTAFGCENGLVAEYDFFEDHRKSTTESYSQFFLKGMRDPIFTSLPYKEYDTYCDQSPVKSIRYCSSEYSSCIDDIVITKSNGEPKDEEKEEKKDENEEKKKEDKTEDKKKNKKKDKKEQKRGDSAYKFSPGRSNPVVSYIAPDGLNISCAAFAYNHNRQHQRRHNSCENYIVCGTEEGTVVAFHAETGELVKGGTDVIDDPSSIGNIEMRYLTEIDKIASIASYVPIRKYFPYEKAGIDPNLATRITSIDAVPDPHMGTFVVGGWGINPLINIYKFQDDSEYEHLLKF